MSARLKGRGDYAASERHLVITANTWTPRAASPLCVVAHGALADGWSYAPPAFRRDLDRLADAGFVVVSADLGGISTWGNETFRARADDVIAWAGSELGADTGRVSWVGDSMGAAGACQWAMFNPTRIGGIVVRLGAVDLDGIVTRDPSGLAALIEDAWGGDWDAARPFADPALNTSMFGRLAGRILLWVSTDDPIMDGEDTDWGRAVGAQVHAVGAVGHDAEVFYAAVPGDYQARFVSQHHRRPPPANEQAVQAEEDRWLQLQRAGAPFAFKGGDITDSVVLPDQGDGVEWVLWVGSDLFAQGGNPKLEDTFTGGALPFDTGLILQQNGEFSHQVYREGESGIAFRPDQTEFPDLAYWALACCMDGGLVRVACALVDRTIGTYGSRLDSHIVSFDPTELVAGGNTNMVDVVHVGSDMSIFDIMGLTPGGDGWVYITGGEFVPPFDDGYGLGDLSESVVRHRIARAPEGQLNDPSTWRYWTGTGWSVDQGEADPIRDHNGQAIEGGDFGMTRLAGGDWLGVDHQLVASSVRHWRASSPVGPWTLTGTVPAPDFGKRQYTATRLGQFARPAPHVPAPAGHMMVHVVAVPIGADPGVSISGQLLRAFTPRFFPVPLSPS